MTDEEKVEAYKMRLEGSTLQEIADTFGVSKQYIYQIIPYVNRSSCNKSCSCIYPNIQKWRKKNKVSMDSMAVLCGLHRSTLARSLAKNGNPTKKVIDKILKTTGMTYEEAFKTEE